MTTEEFELPGDPELGAAFSRFTEEMDRVDELAITVLKGHLLLEEKLVSIIECFLFNRKHLDSARLGFAQKLEMCRGFALRKSDLSIWTLISCLNSLRNAVAHSLDIDWRKSAMAKFTRAYLDEISEEH